MTEPQQPPPPRIDRPAYPTINRKALDRWARDTGWANFDTFVRVGGSIFDARRDIAQRISELEQALRALDAYNGTHDGAPGFVVRESIPAANAESDEPPDPHNAHSQGADA